MQIVHWGRARSFYRKHRYAEEPLKRWKKAVRKATWKNFFEVRKAFNSVDWVEGRMIFNIKGNDFRLIAIVEFTVGKLYIKPVLTHEEYDKGEWKK